MDLQSGLVIQAKPLEEGLGSANRLNTVLTQLHKEKTTVHTEKIVHSHNHFYTYNSDPQSSLLLFFDLVRVFGKIYQKLSMFFCHFLDYKRCFKYCDIIYLLYVVYSAVDRSPPKDPITSAFW